jgi:hypothetical protein
MDAPNSHTESSRRRRRDPLRAQPLDAFTFAELQRRTAELSGRERLEVFHRLPPEMQEQAWRDLAEWADDRSAHDFEACCR